MFTDSVEDGFSRPKQKLPGLFRTCRQLRTTSPLYFELSEVHLGARWDLDVTVQKWRMTREAILGFVQALPETQLSMIRRASFTVLRAIDLLHAITSHGKEVADCKHKGDVRPANILPLASMTGLKRLTINVIKWDSTADVAPDLKSRLSRCNRSSDRAKVPCSHIKACSRLEARKLKAVGLIRDIQL